MAAPVIFGLSLPALTPSFVFKSLLKTRSTLLLHRCRSNGVKFPNPHKTSVGEIQQKRTKGMDLLRNPNLNKGMAFTLRERMVNGIHGLLPPGVIEQDQQVFRCMTNIYRLESDLDRHMYLIDLQDRNEKLFYRLLSDFVEQMMPVVYTPTVGLACQKFGMIYRRPRGLYITINDKGHVHDILCNWPVDDIKAIVVTDGERILGLGDLGAYGMGIPSGKLSLYTALGGIEPRKTLPIVIDVGTNNERLRKDPLYIGLRQNRVRGESYIELLDEFMEAVVRRFGHYTLVQFEDFASQNAFPLLDRYRDAYLCFNDDIQGTAAVGVAGLLTSMRITGKSLADNTFLFQGAGGAATGIAQLLVRAMVQWEGLTYEKAVDRIWMVDIDGLLTKDRRSGSLTAQNAVFAKDHAHSQDLEDIVRDIRPTAIIGAAAVRGAFTPGVLRAMAEISEHPVIFALSNPTSKCECTAEEAYTHTDGKCVFASGSPFESVQVGYDTFRPSQGNNAYIFPGVALGAVLFRMHHITEETFLIAAKAVSESVKQRHLDEGRLYPPISHIRDISVDIAVAIGEYAYREKLAATYPMPDDLRQHVIDHLYSTDYGVAEPTVYDWPRAS